MNDIFTYFWNAEETIKWYEWRYGNIFENPPYDEFNKEVFERLDFSKFPPSISSVFPKIIPEYTRLKLLYKLKTGKECLEFNKRIKDLINKGNDESLDRISRERALSDALLEVIKIAGPHATKQFQLFSSKDKSDWVMSAVNESRSNLPAMPYSEVRSQLIKHLQERNEHDLAEHFDEYFQLDGGVQAGSVGTIVFAKYREDPSSEDWNKVVVKLPKAGIRGEIQRDANDMLRAFQALVDRGEVTSQQAKSFMEFNDMVIESEMQEVDVSRENTNLDKVGDSYDGRYITTCKRARGRIVESLRDVAVVMYQAPGEGMGGRLKKLREQAHISNDRARHEEICKEVAAMRRAYAEFAQKNTNNILANRVIHSDPHLGNFNWDYNPDTGKGTAYVFDFGATIDSASNLEEHLQLKQFLFHLNLSMGTGDAHYLRIFYEKYYRSEGSEKRKSEIPEDKLTKLFDKVQAALDDIKDARKSWGSIPVDEATRNVIEVMAKEAIDNAQEYGINILPNSVMELARTNTLVAVGLEELTSVLRDSKYKGHIPFTDRSQLGLSVKASIFGADDPALFVVPRVENIPGTVRRLWGMSPWAEEYWTKEAWSYALSHITDVNHISNGLKFIRGLVGVGVNEDDNDDVADDEMRFQPRTQAPLANTWSDRIAMSIAHRVSTQHALSLYEWSYGLVSSQQRFKSFSEVFFGRADMSKLPKEIASTIPLVLPAYIKLRIPQKFRTAKECIEFKRYVDRLIDRGNDSSLDDRIRSASKREALVQVTSVVGPHAIRQFQLLGSKEKSDWVMDVLRLSRTMFPPATVDDTKSFLIQALREKGCIDYAKDFDKLIQLEEVPRTSFTSDIVFARFRDSPVNDHWKRVVIKIPRRDMVKDILKDGEDFKSIFKQLATDGRIDDAKASYHILLTEELIDFQLQELDASRENENLDEYGHLFNSADEKGRVRCVERIRSAIFDTLEDECVAMGRAPGKRLGDYVETLKKGLREAKTQPERDAILTELAAIRTAYAEFAQLNAFNVVENNITHTNPHSGCLNWNSYRKLNDYSKYSVFSGLMYVYSLNSLVRVASTKEKHKRLKQFFFHLTLAAATCNINFLRSFYVSIASASEEAGAVDVEHLEELLLKLQNHLNSAYENWGSGCANVDGLLRSLVDIIIEEAVSNPKLSRNSLLPDELVHLSRTHNLLVEEFESLDADLDGTSLSTSVPFLSRTQLGISFKALLFGNITHPTASVATMSALCSRIKSLMPWNETYWSTASCKHFLKFPRLSDFNIGYTRKFVHSALRLNDREKLYFDIGVVSSTVTAASVSSYAVVLVGRRFVRLNIRSLLRKFGI
mmetsp:Transcript_25461/g.37548  ORF Transcript_25461/g.37548 Transcript_25461/m.37548 type:complete len:1333 (+) Transcript_25461:89-4087(+)